jgi:hypothetical protein
MKTMKLGSVIFGSCLYALGCGGETGSAQSGSSGTGGPGGTPGAGGSSTGGRTGGPPAPPAQAAVGITVLPVNGQCPFPGSPIVVPADPAGQPNAVNGALLCDLTTPGCKPDNYVVVHGDTGVAVQCTVSPKGDGSFDIQVSVQTTRLNFSASGNVTPAGGVVSVNVYEQSSDRSITDNRTGCKITIPANQGTMKKGAIWARFTCDALVDPKDSGGAVCKATGQFIFENCAG